MVSESKLRSTAMMQHGAGDVYQGQDQLLIEYTTTHGYQYGAYMHLE